MRAIDELRAERAALEPPAPVDALIARLDPAEPPAPPRGENMPKKCEHGLTLKECHVCASPKYGERAAADARDALHDAELLRGLAKNDLLKNAPLAVFVVTKAAATIEALYWNISIVKRAIAEQESAGAAARRKREPE
jgi:hypothetical protein